jgi:tellurium resistance protein TerD
MSINLTKGGRIDLSKSPELKRVRVGLAWNPNISKTGTDFDLDASLFVCKEDASAPAGASLISDNHFVFYNNASDPEGACKHSGDNKTGASAGDDESIVIDLAKINPNAQELSFIVTIFEADERKQNFGQVPKSSIALYNDETGAEIARYSLEEDFSSETSVQFGSLYKRDNKWMFKAVGTGYHTGLADYVRIYGGNLA